MRSSHSVFSGCSDCYSGTSASPDLGQSCVPNSGSFRARFCARSDFEDRGIEDDNVVAIKKYLTYMSNENKNNFFAYKNMEMYVNGQPSTGSDWGSENVEYG